MLDQTPATVVTQVLNDLNDALTKPDPNAASTLFETDGYWRDLRFHAASQAPMKHSEPYTLSIQQETGWIGGLVAEELKKPWVVFAGRSEQAGEAVRTLLEIEPDATRAMAGAESLLAELAARWAQEQ